MKTLIAALAAVTTVTAFAAPAAAQSYGRPDQGRWEQAPRNLNQRQAQLNRQIEIGARQGVITRREAANLRNQSYEIARLEARYRVNGLNGWERDDLGRRFDRLETRIERQIYDREYGHGYGHRR